MPVVSLYHKDIKSFTYAYNNIFGKIFKSFNENTIAFCQYYCHFLPFYAYYDYLRFCFLSNKFNQGILLADDISDEGDFLDFTLLSRKYSILPSFSKASIKFKLWTFVEAQLFS